MCITRHVLKTAVRIRNGQNLWTESVWGSIWNLVGGKDPTLHSQLVWQIDKYVETPNVEETPSW